MRGLPATNLGLTAWLVKGLRERLLRCVSRVRSPHGINICMAYRSLFRIWLFVYVIFYVCKRIVDIGIIPSVHRSLLKKKENPGAEKQYERNG